MPPISPQRSSKRPALLLLLSLLALPSVGGAIAKAPEPAQAFGALCAWGLLFGYAVRCAFVEGGRIVRVVAVLLCLMFGSAFAVGMLKGVEKRRLRATQFELQVEDVKHVASEVVAEADQRLLAALDRLDAECVLWVPAFLLEPEGVASSRSVLVEYRDASVARIADQPALMKRLASRVAESGVEKQNVDAFLSGARSVWPEQRALLDGHVEVSEAYLRYIEFVAGERVHLRIDDEGEFEIEDEQRARDLAALLDEVERREDSLALAQEALIAKVNGL